MRVPSTQALRALECFARHGTVWQAAEVLNLTRSAISLQLRLLERDLDFPLLACIGTRVELSPRGRAYAEDIRQASRAITGSAARNTGRGAVVGPLVISSAPGFASGWLCNRISRFARAYPEVALTIVTPSRLGEVNNSNVDAFIAFGDGDYPEMQVEHILDVVSTPVCSPAMVNQLGGMPEPADVLRLGLLHLTDRQDWEGWFAAAGLDPARVAPGVVFSDIHLVYAAALAGQGIAIGDIVLCADAMASGQLVRPFDQTVRARDAYFLAVPLAITESPVVIAFRSWLRGERDKSFPPSR